MKGVLYMFDKKYKKALEILDDEIEMYRRLYRDYLELSDASIDKKSKTWNLDKSIEYQKMTIELSHLKAKIRKEIGS